MSAEVIDRFFKSSGAGDVETAVECFADNGQWITSDGDGLGTVHTKDQLGDLMNSLNATRETMIASGVDAKFESPIMLGENLGLVRWTVETNDGKVMNRGVDLFVLSDGKIVLKDVYRKV
ncbi:nuclear transport factor 2 family protein [Amycolatopsis sp. H20-H5]|uniref:nuclear transport factor 2 family protein n=1 Tax=Amycolatopsis sp. H20-H5 TaxID=3046309 RepID=UPI002DB76C33|nr:nuclear transport factor 2 family protein [Amycolatopsis sp. H20-H5]MEC3976978.1 nuclear transport factor 2 family protein [Amycolatopsis sp. H20-H5]